MSTDANSALDTSALDPAAVAGMVAQTSDDQLAAGMQSPARGQILDEIFKRMEEHFEADKAQGVDAVIDWRILERPDGGEDRYVVSISGGTLHVDKGPESPPPARTTFKVKPVDFLKLVTGNADGAQLFMTGALQIEGDLMFAAQVQAFFRVPSAPPAG